MKRKNDKMRRLIDPTFRTVELAAKLGIKHRNGTAFTASDNSMSYLKRTTVYNMWLEGTSKDNMTLDYTGTVRLTQDVIIEYTLFYLPEMKKSYNIFSAPVKEAVEVVSGMMDWLMTGNGRTLDIINSDDRFRVVQINPDVGLLIAKSTAFESDAELKSLFRSITMDYVTALGMSLDTRKSIIRENHRKGYETRVAKIDYCLSCLAYIVKILLE